MSTIQGAYVEVPSDPTTTGYTAVMGTVVRFNGALYQKTGGLDTDWTTPPPVGGGGGPPTGSAGGDLAGTYPNPSVANLTETSGPTSLTLGAVADTQFLKRVGSTVVGAAAPASDGKVLITGADTTTGFLGAKIVAGSNITLTTLNPGANETLEIASSGGGAPTGAAGGDLGSTYPNPTVTAVHETSGPTKLTLGSVAIGEYLTRVGSTLVGGTPGGGPPSGSAGGDLGGTYPNPEVAAIHETGGPTKLTVGAVANTQMLVRSGTTLIGQTVATALPPNGAAGGDLGGTYPNPDVTAIHETSGPTQLVVGAVANTQMLVRSGTTLIGQTVATALPPNGSAGGDLGGAYPNPTVAAIRETSGPTSLVVGAVAANQILQRVGATLVGVALPTSDTLQTKVTVSDTTPGFLSSKVVAGANVTVSVVNPGANETLSIASTGGGGVIGATGDKLFTALPVTSGASFLNATATPTICGTVFVNPADFTLTGATMSIKFRAVANTGNGTIVGHVKVRDVTNSVDIHDFTITNVTPQKLEATFTLGTPGTDVIANADTRYEVTIYVTSPTGPTDFIELYGSEFRIINTVN